VVRRTLVFVTVLALATTAVADDELPNAVPTVMYKRWGFAMGYGPALLRARTDSASSYVLAGVDWSLRLRLRSDVEVAASLIAAVARYRGYASLSADLRYRLFAERPWNAYVLAGIGPANWFDEEGTVLHLRAGAGLERRFQSWAFSAELFAARVGNVESVQPRNVQTTFASHGVWNGSLLVAAIYYWGSGGRSLRRHGVP